MTSILTLLLALATLALAAPAAAVADSAVPDEELSYQVGADRETSTPVFISWHDNWLSLSIVSSRGDCGDAFPLAFVVFGARSSAQGELPMHLDIRIQGEAEVLDMGMLPDDIRSCIEAVSQMAALTLEKDQSAGKLSPEAVRVLERLRDRQYSFSEMQGSFIDLRWSHEYAGSVVVLELDYTSPDSSCSFQFSRDSFSIQLHNGQDFGTITAEYRDGALHGGCRLAAAQKAPDEAEALARLLRTLDTIDAIFEAAKQPPPDEVMGNLRRVRETLAQGFASFEETALPVISVGGT